jgi:hypothetical protein
MSDERNMAGEPEVTLPEVQNAPVAERPITRRDQVVAWATSPEPAGKAEPGVTWMPAREAARHLGMSIAGIRKRAKEGRMPSRREGPHKFDRVLVGVPA